MTQLTQEEIDKVLSPQAAGVLDKSFIRQCADDLGVSVEALRGHSRKQPLARARQLVMWKMRKAGFSYSQIGYALNRDHTTIIHGERRIEKIMREMQ